MLSLCFSTIGKIVVAYATFVSWQIGKMMGSKKHQYSLPGNKGEASKKQVLFRYPITNNKMGEEEQCKAMKKFQTNFQLSIYEEEN
jgi:hypothetical protein